LVEHANGAMFDPTVYALVAETLFQTLDTEVLEELGLAPAAEEAATARGSAWCGVGARQHISAAAAPCLPLMRTAPT
jgi:hypothetical protein